MHIKPILIDDRAGIMGDDGDGWRVLAGTLQGESLSDLLSRPHLADECRAAYNDGSPLHANADIRDLPLVGDAAKIYCAGFNYRAPGRERPEYPTLFLRTAASVVVHESPVVVPRVSPMLDWEGEVAIVIGTPARHVDAGNAWEHVAALTCFADNTVRDFAKHGTQATAGKNFESSGAVGPAFSLCDGIPLASDVHLVTRLNGEQMQSGSLGDLLYPVEELISYLSDITTLNPGDIIATGTPPGIGARRQPPRYLESGDVLEVEVTGVGILRNTVRDEDAA